MKKIKTKSNKNKIGKETSVKSLNKNKGRDSGSGFPAKSLIFGEA